MDEATIWFERPIHPELLDQIPPDIQIIEPNPGSDPYDGIDRGRGVMASALPYTRTVIDRALTALVIARTGIGVDLVDVEAATNRGIAVCNTPDGPTVPTAEHTVALLLTAAKRVTQAATALRNAEGNYYSRYAAIELEGKTLGLIGFGRIARRVARAAEGLGMSVVAYDPLAAADGFFVQRLDDLDELLASSDVVSIHVPLTTDTRHLMNRTRFGLMRPGAILVNTSRGGVIDQAALLEALDSGRLFAAALDVTEPEPLPPDHPLLNRPNVVVTPHVASGTNEGRARIFLTALSEVLAVLKGQRPEHLVNPEVWPRVVDRISEANRGQ